MASKRSRRSAPRQFVISFRVNAREWEELKRQTESSGTSVSKLLRANLHLLLGEKGSHL